MLQKESWDAIFATKEAHSTQRGQLPINNMFLQLPINNIFSLYLVNWIMGILVWMNVFMHVCMYACMHECMYISVYAYIMRACVCMYACIIHIHDVCMYLIKNLKNSTFYFVNALVRGRGDSSSLPPMIQIYATACK